MSDKDPNVIMMKGALKPSLVVGVLGLILSTWLQGSAGLYGALLAHSVDIFIIREFSDYSTKLRIAALK